jgi:alpha-mannosidase
MSEKIDKPNLHLIGNAHLDPIWLWRWQEGCGEVLQTFRSALDRLNEYGK